MQMSNSGQTQMGRKRGEARERDCEQVTRIKQERREQGENNEKGFFFF